VKLAEMQPDVVGTTAITPSIYVAEDNAALAKEVLPDAVTILGGIHATFMYKQVLSEAQGIDLIVRGEGEEIIVEVMRAIADGAWRIDRRQIKGLAFMDGEEIVATPAAPTVKDSMESPPTGAAGMVEIHLRAARRARGDPQHGARLSLHLLVLLAVEVLARLPRARPDQGRRRDRGAGEGARRRLLHPRRRGTHHQPASKFIQFCEELIARDLPRRVQWGINTRVTDIMRDKELLPLYRKAGLVHVSLGTEAAAQLKLDQFNKETKVEENKEAIRLLREADIFTEAQFIVGLDNETPETLEETFQMAVGLAARPRQLGDVHALALHAALPGTEGQGRDLRLLEVQLRHPDHAPAAMDRATLLDRVMHNYRRFYSRKALFHYPWRGTGYRRKYLLGCLKAFAKAGSQRQFYDLGKHNYWGPQSKEKVVFNFDRTRTIAKAQMEDWQSTQDLAAQKRARKQALDTSFKMPNGARSVRMRAGAVKACGGGDQQMMEPAE
jgi:anaerobic magnesium-protoporphyrin IX monomethyl ester cyclase